MTMDQQEIADYDSDLSELPSDALEGRYTAYCEAYLAKISGTNYDTIYTRLMLAYHELKRRDLGPKLPWSH